MSFTSTCMYCISMKAHWLSCLHVSVAHSRTILVSKHCFFIFFFFFFFGGGGGNSWKKKNFPDASVCHHYYYSIKTGT
ncbi:hypothetical protein I7I48_11554 [Histoplasma ohiense]|nr:hypothetical protein I7I48_11554 [Histoplasma ohiense (nom. inval.)]